MISSRERERKEGVDAKLECVCSIIFHRNPKPFGLLALHLYLSLRYTHLLQVVHIYICSRTISVFRKIFILNSMNDRHMYKTQERVEESYMSVYVCVPSCFYFSTG